MKTLSMTAGAVVACLVAGMTGCASAPPAELKNARTAYSQAATAPGASLAQSDVYAAKVSLDRAEQQFADNGDAAETRDLAYVAERKAVIARANGNSAVSMQQKQLALNDLAQLRAQAMRDEIGKEKTQAQLESERAARVAAEKRMLEALQAFKGVSAKLDQRGLVVTLTGGVLFAFGKSDLLPGANKRLDEVVAALKNDPRPLSVEGHTDSIGSDETNLRLSEKRAETVRNYLITHGIDESRVTAKGMGKAEPVADNKSAEGRANNRRVDIILTGMPTTGGPMPGGGEMPTPGATQPDTTPPRP